MNEKMVSIIIPVYNAEAYIENCIKSVISQSYRNLEILIVNDGSNDNSAKICDKYAEVDDRIKVIHIENNGVSNARNTAISFARGQYIQFVDSDDLVKENMTELLVNDIEVHNADMVICGYDCITEYVTRKDRFYDKDIVYDNKQYLRNILRDPLGYYYGVVWNKLFKRVIIEKYNISFDTDQTLGEDFVFNLEYLKYIDTVKVLNKRLYIYNYFNIGSLSRYKEISYEVMIKEFLNRKKIFRKYKDTFISLGIYNENEKKIYAYWKFFYYENMYGLKFGNGQDERIEKLKFKKLLKNDIEIETYLNTVGFIEDNAIFLTIFMRKNIQRVKSMVKVIIKNVLNPERH